MKKLLLLTVLAILGVTQLNAQTARVQIIHNAADPAADSVDIYVNGALTFNDFKFRTATGFTSLPAGVALNIGVAPGNSTGAGDILATFPVTFTPNDTVAVIANGVLNPASFASNPDGESTGFQLWVDTDARETGMAGSVYLKAVHGATDAPTVDVVGRGVATLVNDAAYGDFTPFFPVPPGSYTLDITPGADNDEILMSYSANLSALGGGAAYVLASGFLDPAANNNGAPFALIAVLADGTVLTLPTVQNTARVQVVHNAADPAAEMVDIYLDGSLLLNDFTFRTATPYVDFPAGRTATIGVAPGNSTSSADIIASFPVNLDINDTVLVVANGVLNPASFASNPDNENIAFTLWVDTDAREAGTTGEVNLKAVHGSTDAPTVDIIARNVATLVNDATYGDITAYIPVPASNYIIDITPGSNNSTIVASFTADLTALAGQNATVLASGFLDPSMNQNGEAFTLIAVLADGTVVELGNITGIDQDLFNGEVKAFYNASSEAFMINITSDKSTIANISLLNIIGKLLNIKENNPIVKGNNKFSIPAEGLAKGVYLIRIENEGNLVTKKLIVK